jgi:glycosyltransferase involved in cell wall biosynthesis
MLPYQAQRLKLDVCIFFNFASPVINCKKIAFVFDVIFASNPEYFTALERLYFSPIRILASNADRVCTISHSEKDRMVRYGFSREELIDVVHLGVDEKFRGRDSHRADQLSVVRDAYNLPQKFILYVGRLNIRKNIGALLHALSLVRDKSIPLVIAGEQDWKMPDIESTIDELGIRNRLIFTGRVKESHIEHLFALATIFAYPSLEEGFGLPPLEAMASGVPVVVSNSSSLPEVCGDAALYADPHDPVNIAGRIDALLENSELTAAMRAKGIIRAQQFTWERSANQLYRSVIQTMSDSAESAH